MRRRPVPEGESGLILVNVLMFVAIAAGLVLLMINREELALDRGLRMREAARALAIVRGGEISALVALRRDIADPQGAQADHRAEPWAALTENGAKIEGGTFDLAISDAQGRFNINSVRSGAAAPVIVFQRIGKEIGLSPEQIVKAVETVRLIGPVTDLRPLRATGVAPEAAAKLERLVTALPGITTINLNTADEELLAILFDDAAVARRLVARREKQGFLTVQDLSDAQVVSPFGTDFKSNTFWVRTRATIGTTAQDAATLIQRRQRDDGSWEVVPVERWRGAAVPPGAPEFPN